MVGLYIFFSLALRMGFDITDEGFYLMTVSVPESYLQTTSMFGGVLGPLWRLSGENVYLYRLLQWWVILGLSFTLFGALIDKSYQAPGYVRYLLASALASSVVIHLYHWLPTPNYNSVTLTALLLFSIAFTRFKDWDYGRVLSIAGATALAFLAKPTTAAGLAFTSVVLCFCMPSVYKFRRRAMSLFIAGLICVLAISAFAFLLMGSLKTFYSNLAEGIYYGSLLIGSEWTSFYDILWRGEFRKFNLTSMQLAVFMALVLMLAFVAVVKTKPVYLAWDKAVAWCFAVLLALICFGVIFGFLENPLISASIADRFAIFAVTPLAALLTSILVLVYRGTLSARDLCLAVTLASLPYAFTIGTSTNYYGVFASSSVFLYAGCVVLNRQSKSLVFISSLAFCAVAAAIVSMPIGGKSVYRQVAFSDPEINISSFSSVIDGRLKGLYLHSSAALYFNQLSKLALENGFRYGDGVVDLTGASPGSIFVIGGESIGSAWLIGGYDGSERTAKQRLMSLDHERLRSSWLLIENWKRSISIGVLGLDEQRLADNYELVGSVTIPAGLGGRKEAHRQMFYKPKQI